jgi:hypothetical protein
MTRTDGLTLAAAVPIGLVIGLLDRRAEEVQPAVLLFLVSGAVLGALSPRFAVATGVLLGLGVPIVHAWVRLNHLPLPYPMDSYASAFIALIPATLGTLAGAWARRLAVLA